MISTQFNTPHQLVSSALIWKSIREQEERPRKGSKTSKEGNKYPEIPHPNLVQNGYSRGQEIPKIEVTGACDLDPYKCYSSLLHTLIGEYNGKL